MGDRKCSRPQFSMNSRRLERPAAIKILLNRGSGADQPGLLRLLIDRLAGNGDKLIHGFAL